MLSNKPSMVSGPTGYNINIVNSFQIFLCKPCIIKINVIIFVNSAVQSFYKHFWLFKNFFFHKILISTFRSSFQIPLNMSYISFYLISVYIHNFYRVFFYFHNFIIFNQVYIPSIFQNCRNIRRNKVFSLSKPYNKWTFLSCRNNSVRLVYRHNPKCIRTFYNF